MKPCINIVKLVTPIKSSCEIVEILECLPLYYHTYGVNVHRNPLPKWGNSWPLGYRFRP